jgi:large subunit ribosomal protein L4
MGLDTYPFNEIKTKNAVNTLKNLNIIDKKTLLVLSQKNPIVEKSFSNIDTVKYILVDYLNPVDLLHHDNVVFLEDSVQKIQNILSA